MQKSNANIILFGVPRCGSSWLSEVLTHQTNIRLVHEPDNELKSYLGMHLKRGLPRFPFLLDHDSHEDYLRLFKLALTNRIAEQGDWQNKLPRKLFGLTKEKLQQRLSMDGTALKTPVTFDKLWLKLTSGQPTNERVLVKTVHGLLALPFLASKLDFIPLVLQRHPLNVFSSYSKMNMPDGNRRLYRNSKLLNHYSIPAVEDENQLSTNYLSGYQLGIFNKVINTYGQSETIINVVYEDLISDPFVQMKNLFNKLSIEFTNEVETFMASKFKKGEGYDTSRELKGHEEVWKKRLSTEQVEEFVKGYEFAFGSINFDV
jgi:hypothetical protein